MEHNDIIGIIPWPMAFLTALWFGVMALKAQKNAVLWAVGGAVLGLIVTTIILGLSQAVFIPMTDDQVTPFRVKMTLVAVIVVVGVGWLFAGSLHRHLWAIVKRPADPSPGDQLSKLPADTSKKP